MTGIVIATVIIFAALVGGADYLLSLGVKQAVTPAGERHDTGAGGDNRPVDTAPAATVAPTVSP